MPVSRIEKNNNLRDRRHRNSYLKSHNAEKNENKFTFSGLIGRYNAWIRFPGSQFVYEISLD